jgi:acetamidase/formamidase
MCTDAKHTIHHKQHHFGWDNALQPIDTVAPGTTIAFECKDASAGQITAESTTADVDTLDFALVNPVTGPIYIDGAEPGDVLKVTVDSFRPSGFGWTANIPGFGLLTDQFPQSALHIWKYDTALKTPAAFGPGGKVPLRPFAGTMGVAPAEAGLHSIVPPRRVGGNMDIRDLGAGTILYLPIEVAGGLFSIGDTHAAQGDGEVCGTALETPMSATVTLDLVKDENLQMPRFTTPGPVTQHLDQAGYEVTTGIGEDLMQGAYAALSQMVELLAARYNMAAVDAYMLCSVCGDLRISEIVDQPNWIVSFYFPRIVLD